MKTADLIAQLAKMPQDADIIVAVGWNKDTAFSDKVEDLTIEQDDDGTVTVRGWMSNCNTELEVGAEDDEDDG